MGALEQLAGYLSYPFVVNALIVGVLVALCSSLLGTTLVMKRLSYIGDGLSHVAFGAYAVAAVAGISQNLLVITPVTVLAAILLLRRGQSSKVKGDAALAMMSVSLLTGLVYVVSMILKGAYFGISGRWKKWTACILIIGLLNFYTGARDIAANGLTDGRLTLDNVRLPLGIVFLVIAVTVFFQKAREGREENS